MLPEKLTIQAFGPYVEKQEIDFSSFSKHHLFLIRGETGSGKTMILDAITFALFGKSSGGQRDSMETMRSRFAPDECDTVVDFIFSLKGKRYRFIRKVEVRTKRNQEKVWKSSVDAGEISDGQFFPFFENPKLKNVEEKAEKLIGLKYEQFVQVMVLPQGKFEQFLTSKSEEKQEILKTLFQMERWEAINEWLVEHLKKEKQKLDEMHKKMSIYLETLKEESLESAKANMIDIEKKLEGKGKELQKQELYVENIEKELVQQREWNEVKKELESCEKKLEKLNSKNKEIEKQKQEIQYYNKLKSVLPYFESFQTATKQYETRLQQLFDAKSKLHNIQKEIELEKQREKTLDTLQEKHKTYSDTYKQREEEIEILKEVQTLSTQLEKYKQMESSYIEKEKKADEDLLNALHKKDIMHMKIQSLKQELTKKSDIEKNYQLFDKAKQMQNEKDQLDTEIYIMLKEESEQKCLLEKNEKEVEKAEQEHEKIYQAYLHTSALQLSLLLKEGEPCPVCGSCHHPSYAHIQESVVDLQKLKMYKDKLEQTKQAYQLQKDQLKEISLMIEGKKNRCIQIEEEIKNLIHTSFSVEQYEKAKLDFQEFQAKEHTWNFLLEEDANIQNEIQMLYVFRENLQKDIGIWKEKRSILETTFLEKNKSIKMNVSVEERKQELSEISSKLMALEKEIEKLKEIIEYVKISYVSVKESYIHAQKEEALAKQEKEMTYASFVAQCETHKINWEEVQHIPQESMMVRMQEEVQKHEQMMLEYFTKKEMLKKRLQDAVFKDLSLLQEESMQAKEIQKLLQEEKAQLQGKWKLYHDTLKKAQSQQKRLEEETPKFLKKQHFVKAMRGDNGVGIERYVLGVLLQTILQYANQLLNQVHDGRYRLYRSDSAIGRIRKSGLELGIYDFYSMDKRSVVSLSGGEKFLVSLALSLATSFVVQSRNGGMQLDTMFIDEGFGTLDEHSIADALHILQTMTNRKGMVGIISHVEILKENIPDGIEVKKTRNGSSIQIRKV